MAQVFYHPKVSGHWKELIPGKSLNGLNFSLDSWGKQHCSLPQRQFSDANTKTIKLTQTWNINNQTTTHRACRVRSQKRGTNSAWCEMSHSSSLHAVTSSSSSWHCCMDNNQHASDTDTHTHRCGLQRGTGDTPLQYTASKYNQKEIFPHQEFNLDFTITFVQFDVLRYTEMNHLQKMFGSEAQVIPTVHTLINLRGKQWGKGGKLVTPLHMHTVQRWVAGRSACTAHLCWASLRQYLQHSAISITSPQHHSCLCSTPNS